MRIRTCWHSSPMSVEVHQRPTTVHHHRGVDLSGHAVRGVRAELWDWSDYIGLLAVSCGAMRGHVLAEMPFDRDTRARRPFNPRTRDTRAATRSPPPRRRKAAFQFRALRRGNTN